MSDARLHTDAPPSRWPRRGLILARNVACGFVMGMALWVLALLGAALLSLAAPSMGQHAAAGAWQAAWTPSGFLYVGGLMAGVVALLTVVIWAVLDQRDGTR
jgi:hypothetical protein